MTIRKTNTWILLFLTLLSPFIDEIKAQTLEIVINEPLQKYSESLLERFDEIPDKRKTVLNDMAKSLSLDYSEHNRGQVLFVCTHNSRRSQISQLWFQFATLYYGIQQFESFSGGMEATAFNSNAISAVERAGFTVVYDKKKDNPIVQITPGNYPVWNFKSKVYTDDMNPKNNFVAAMVCSDADKSCPTVEGAVDRFALPFEDPRYYDDTPSQDKMYDKTVEEIGTEMFYLVSQVKKDLILKIESNK